VDAQRQLREAVAIARADGDSWTVIGAALDSSRQAAFRRFGHDLPQVSDEVRERVYRLSVRRSEG